MSIESNCSDTISLIEEVEGRIGGSFDFVKSSLSSIPPLLKRRSKLKEGTDISGIIHEIGKSVMQLRRNVDEIVEIWEKKGGQGEVDEKERNSFDQWGALFIHLKSQLLVKIVMDAIHRKVNITGVYSKIDEMAIVLSKGSKMIWENTLQNAVYEKDLTELAKFALVCAPYMENATCCAHACEYLHRRCFLGRDPLEELVRNGSVKLVCGLLSEYRTHGLFSTHAFALLCQFTRGGFAAKEAMIRTRSFAHLIIDTIKIHIDNTSVIEQSGLLLCSLSELKEFRALVQDDEILPLLRTIASKYAKNNRVMKWIAGFLANLAESLNWIKKIAMHGLHARILDSLKEHICESDSEGVNLAFHFIKNMSVSPEIVNSLCRMGVVPLLLNGIEKSKYVDVVAYPGCAALHNILYHCANPSCSENTNSEEIIHLGIKVMEMNAEHSFVLTPVVSLFWILVRFSEHESILLKNDVFRDLAELMTRHVISEDFVKRCLVFLWDISHESHAARDGMYLSDIVDAISDCAKYHRKNKEIVFLSLSVLGNLLFDGREWVYSDCSHTTSWAIELSQEYGRDDVIVGCVCKMLLLLARHNDVVVRSTIIRNGAIECLESAKQHFPENEFFSEHIPLAIKELTQPREEHRRTRSSHVW
jgi:hypothetical protein